MVAGMDASWTALADTVEQLSSWLGAALVGARPEAVKRRARRRSRRRGGSENPLRGLGNLRNGSSRPRKVGAKRPVAIVCGQVGWHRRRRVPRRAGSRVCAAELAARRELEIEVRYCSERQLLCGWERCVV